VARIGVNKAAQAIARFFFDCPHAKWLYGRGEFLCYPWYMNKNCFRLLDSAMPKVLCAQAAAGKLVVYPAWSVSHE